MTTANLARAFSQSWGLPVSTPAAANHVVDAATDGIGFVFQAQSTQAITHLGFRYGARTGTPPTYIVGLESVVTTSGLPDGTYKTNGGNCSGTFTPPADASIDGKWQWVALANSYTPTLGERLAFTLRHSSGTIDASNYSTLTTHFTNIAPVRSSNPYNLRLTAGTWAKSILASVFGIRTASLRYGPIIEDIYSTRTASTVGHKVAAKISLPGGFGSNYKVAGIRVCGSLGAAASKSPILKLWSGTTALADVALDTEIQGASAGSTFMTEELYFDDSITLDFGTDYHIGFEVADAANGGCILYGGSYASADDFANVDGGAICSLSTDSGSGWVDIPTVRPWMELILDDWTEPSGSGGLVAPIISGSGGLIIR